ncbi:HypA protein [Xylariaceae sp. FL0255]|nr:HypA protein [Xylariaceae sp. FL0255]
MASARTIQITTSNHGLRGTVQSDVAAQKTTELLQRDLEMHHCFFNDRGFHNHISHQVLSLYGLGASTGDIQKGYDANKTYQRSMYQVHENKIDELHNWEIAKERLGKEENYIDFLVFFQKEIDKIGWQNVLNEYLFKGDERSDDLLTRMFAGLIHPLIQLMFGVEWQQPAIVAMGLAQAAVHTLNMNKFLLTAEERAASNETSMDTIDEIFRSVAANEKLSKAARPSDGNKLAAVLDRAWDEVIAAASRVKVRPEELESRTVEMYNTTVYRAAGAAMYPGKIPKFDFTLMHQVNVCPLFLAINAQDWISTSNKVRLLEWKIRFDLLSYASRACAPASLDKIMAYIPKDVETDILTRVVALDDDGHVSKLVRSIQICQQASKKFEEEQWIKLKGGELWSKLQRLALDAAEAPGPRWVRGAGESEAWKASSNPIPLQNLHVMM